MEHTPEKAERLAILKQLIKDLHAGADLEEVKRRFAELIENVGAGEIAALEQALIAEGLPEEEIKRLCDVHVALFQDKIKQVTALQTAPGHPVDTFRRENEALAAVAKKLREHLSLLGAPPDGEQFRQRQEEIRKLLEQLAEVEKHYLRKENQLFPVMERHGIEGPPKVMWSLHDDVRALLKHARSAVSEGDASGAAKYALAFAQGVENMIAKEEKVLFPMVLEKFNDVDWAAVKEGEHETGYALFEPTVAEMPTKAPMKANANESGALLGLATGGLTLEQVNLLLTHLPVDVSFVDESDTVRYYSDVKERIFPRSPGVIGRKVQNCHPPGSVHVVQNILDSFRRGEKDVAEFWINLQGRFVHIRYFAVRDAEGNYRGTLEVSQDLTGIRKLEGERRLLDW